MVTHVVEDAGTEEATLPAYPVGRRGSRGRRYRRRRPVAPERTRARRPLLVVGVAATLTIAVWFGLGAGSRSGPVAPAPLPSSAATVPTVRARPPVHPTAAEAASIHERCGRRLGGSGC